MLIPLDQLIQRHRMNITGILHVGASEGQEREAYDKCGVKKVVWVEALPNVYDRLVANISSYPGHIALNACVSDEDGREVTFHESSNEGQSSSFLELGTHKTAHPEVTYIADHKMVTRRLDTLLLEHQIIDLIDGLNFLAMDLQGAELYALRGMGTLLKQFNYIYIEVNTSEVYKGCAQIDSLDLFMVANQFKRVEEKIFNQWGWGDAVYIRQGS